jgi:hypothetical protein
LTAQHETDFITTSFDEGKSQVSKAVRVLRLLPEELSLRPIVQMILDMEGKFLDSLSFVSLMLQYTDTFNLPLLTHCIENKALIYQALCLPQSSMTTMLLISITRALEAQPYLYKTWDLSPTLVLDASNQF